MLNRKIGTEVLTTNLQGNIKSYINKNLIFLCSIFVSAGSFCRWQQSLAMKREMTLKCWGCRNCKQSNRKAGSCREASAQK